MFPPLPSPLAVELEGRLSTYDDVQLFVAGVFLVLVDEPVAGRLRGPGVHAE
jgi:hypothetical protein